MSRPKDMATRTRTTGWQASAACLGADPEMFASREVEESLAAASMCLDCPVIDLCFDSASKSDKQWTVRGGSMPSKNGGYHGRTDGYLVHRQMGTEECSDCHRAKVVDRLAKDKRKERRQKRARR